MWGKEKRFDIISEPRIAAIYFGLMQGGYEYFSAGKAREDVKLWESWAKMPVSYDTSFFTEARQATPGIYPFSPRAAALEMASFYVDMQNGIFTDEEACLRKIRVSGIIKERELPDFTTWIMGFPKLMKSVMQCEGFASYINWEESWLKQQAKPHKQKLQKYDDVISYFSKKCNPTVSNAFIVYCPLKCTFVSDYFAEGDTLYFISGMLRLEAALKEFLHLMLHPLVQKHSDAICSLRNLHRLRVENTNYGDNNDQAKLAIFEEYAVGELIGLVEENRYKVELEKFLPSLLITLT